MFVRDLGEKRIIEEIVKPACGAGDVRLSIGDDAAIVDVPIGKSLVVSTDKIPEDLLAIQLGLMDPFHHGRYLATVNISDIAAMGGDPAGLLVTLALPDDFRTDYLREFYRGLAAGCAEWNCAVIGGDLGWGSATCMSATSLGFVDPNRALKRSGAKPGDRVFVTGTIGAFNTGLLYFIVARPLGLKLTSEEEEFLTLALIRPIAQVRKGRLLRESGACTSCMDITDGPGRSIRELTTASKCSFRIDEAKLPVHRTTSQVASYLQMSLADVVFGIGLDLQLIGTLSESYGNTDLLSREIIEIGVVEQPGANTLVRLDGSTIDIPQKGWQHFSGKAMEIVRESANKLPG